MKFNNPFFTLLVGVGLFSLFLLPHLCSANLGTFKAKECVNIRVLSNCSSVTLSEVTIKNVTYIVNSGMSKLAGQTFNYSFCNTNLSGTYAYSWNPSCSDCASSNCGNYFIITPDGVEMGQVQGDTSTLGIYILFIIAALLFVGFIFTTEFLFKWSFFLMSLFFMVVGINITSIYMTSIVVNDGIKTIFDAIGGATYYLYYFIGGTMLVLWMITFIGSMVDRKHLNEMRMIGDFK